jgi:hypothetical protein
MFAVFLTVHRVACFHHFHPPHIPEFLGLMDSKWTGSQRPNPAARPYDPAHLSMHRKQIVTDPFFICLAQSPARIAEATFSATILTIPANRK